MTAQDMPLVTMASTTDQFERGYDASEWTIIHWYDMHLRGAGRDPPRRRAVIRNVRTGGIRAIPLTRCTRCGYWSMHWSPCFRCGYPFCSNPACSTRDTFRASMLHTGHINRMWGSVLLCTHCYEMIETGRADRDAAARDAYLNTRARRRFGL